MPDIVWSLTAERDLSRGPDGIRESLILRVELLREYPLLGKALQGEWRAFRQLVREPGRHGLPRIDPIPGRGMDWDNRFTIRLAVGVTAPLLVAALGPEGLALLDGLGQQRPPVPASVLRALPGLWRGRTLIAVPMLGYFSDDIDPAHVDCGFSARPFPECSPGSS